MSERLSTDQSDLGLRRKKRHRLPKVCLFLRNSIHIWAHAQALFSLPMSSHYTQLLFSINKNAMSSEFNVGKSLAPIVSCFFRVLSKPHLHLPITVLLLYHWRSLLNTVVLFFFLFQVRTCLTSACKCLNWTHCSRCLLCCSAARSNSCCFSWRNSSRSWTRVAMSTSLSHNSSTPATQHTLYYAASNNLSLIISI